MIEKLIGIYGASGFGKEIFPLVKANTVGLKNVSICFIDDDCDVAESLGVKVMNYDEFKRVDAYTKKCVIAIANSIIREKLSDKLLIDKIEQFNICASNNVILEDVEMGDGSLLCSFVTLTSDIKIGKSFHANIYSYVAHDCVIGDYVTFAPRVMCNGNVHIDDHAYIGTGAILKQGTPDKPLKIGKGAVVGMGAVVTKDVAPNTVVVGNPAKPLIRK